jgi:predicted esterase
VAKDNALPLIIGAAAVGALLMSRGNGGGGRACPAPDCDDVGPDGGVIAGFRYREFRSSGTTTNEALPMIIRFHGYASASGTLDSAGRNWAGSRPGQKVRVIVPEGRYPTQSGYLRWWTKRAATKDQVALTKEMAREAVAFRAFLCGIQECRPTIGKPVLVGHSQGGMMAYALSTGSPDLITGAVSASGWLPELMWSPKMAPTVGLHGTQDTIVPYDRTVGYWDAMKAKGAPLTTDVFDVGHNPTGGLYTAITSGARRLLGLIEGTKTA